MVKLLFFILLFIVEDYLFFGFIAKFKGKKCNYDCFICDNWACTHGTKQKFFYPVRDWCKWCHK